MSADNVIRIWRKHSYYYAAEQSMEGKTITDLGVWPDLEGAVRYANDYMEENEVEYGLDIKV